MVVGEMLVRKAIEVKEQAAGRCDSRSAAVLERLADLYDEQGDAAIAQLWRDQAEAERPALERLWPEPAVTPSVMAGASHKLGRNERCWCGSELKYKRCWVDSDADPPPRQQRW